MLVPTYRSSTDLQGLPEAKQSIQTTPASFSDSTAIQATDMLSGSLDKVSQGLLATYDYSSAEEQATLDKTKVQDALNAHTQRLIDLEYGKDGYLSKLGGDAVKLDAEGKSLLQVTQDKMMDSYNAAAETLGSAEQRQLFAAHSHALTAQTMRSLQAHIQQQSRVYQSDVAEAGIANEQNKIGLNYNNHGLIDESAGAIGEHYAHLGKLNGWPAEMVQAKTQLALSAALKQGIDSAMQNNDFKSAQALHDTYKNEMVPGDAEQTAKAISSNYIAALADSDPSSLAYATDANSRSIAAIRQIESNNIDHTPDGKPLISSDGKSAFAMQTTHETAKNPGYGIAPAQSMTADEYNRVGVQKHDALAAMYGHDYAKVHAAYNWGEGNVNALIDKYGADWEAHLPDAVKKYVDKGREKMRTDSPLDMATPQQLAHAHQLGLSRIENNTSVYRANLESSINDQLAQLQHTGKTAEGIKNLDDFRLVYGDKAQQKFADYQTQVGFANDVYTLRNMPTEQALTYIAQHKPADDATDAQYEAYDKLQGLVQDKLKTDQKLASETDKNLKFRLENATPEQAAKLLADNQPTSPTRQAYERYNGLQKAWDDEQSARNKDPMSRASEMGHPIGTASLDNPNEFVRTLASRIPVANSLQKNLGTPYALLTNQEAETAQQSFKKMIADDQYELFKKLTSNNLDGRTMYTAIKQVTGGNVSAQMAAAMLQYDGMADTAKTILNGSQLLDRNHNDKVAKLPLPNDAAFNAAIMDRMGTAYIGMGGDAQSVFSTYKKAIIEYYAAKAFETGKLNESGDKTLTNSDLMDEAFNKVTGGVVSYGWGKHNVFVPWGMDADQFDQQLPIKVQATLDKLNIKDDWTAFDLMPSRRNGTYQLMLQGRPIYNGIVDFN